MAPKKNNKKNSAISKLALERVRKVQEEELRIQQEIEEEEKRRKEEEEKLAKLEQERLEKLEKKKLAKKEKILKQKKEGTYLTANQKEKLRNHQSKIQLLQDYHKDVHVYENSDILDSIENAKKDREYFRSPVICILGHVDAGKTKLLDCLRNSNVQQNEAGGITQQMGTTHLSSDIIHNYIRNIDTNHNMEMDMIFLDTPGHEAFSSIRKNGSAFADIVLLIVDVLRGVQQQTIESIQLLRNRNIPYIIVLNKMDRLYGWKQFPVVMENKIEQQDDTTKQEFYDKLSSIILDMNKNEINAELYWNIVDTDYVPIVPISVLTNESIDELLLVISTIVQQKEDLFSASNEEESLQCFVMDNKMLEGYGNTVDVLLKHGCLEEGQKIYLQQGVKYVPSRIKLLLTPPINTDMRVKNEFLTHKKMVGTMGLKIVLYDPILPVIGSNILLEDQESLVIANDLQFDQEGVVIFASTSNSLHALHSFLKNECDPPIPIVEAKIGKIYKKDIVKISLLKNKEEYNVILAFDIIPDEDILNFANENNITILYADIIYHLLEKFKKHQDNLFIQKKEKNKHLMVYPCLFNILKNNIFNKKNPLVLGVEIKEGCLHINTPIFIPKKNLLLGRVIGIQKDHKDVQLATKGSQVAVKIETENPSIQYGRHFDEECGDLVSFISRESINVLKEFFKEEMSKDDLVLIMKLKKILRIS